jgi:hypothetical protein
MARINADEIRQMLFNETPPSRDEYLIFTLIAETRDNLLNKDYSTVIDSTAPDNTTREYLLTTPIKCCIFKFNSNNPQQFETGYTQLEELLESEAHPYKPEFRSFRPTQEIRRALKKLLRT